MTIEHIVGHENREVTGGHRNCHCLAIIRRTSFYFGKLESHLSILSGGMRGHDLDFNRISLDILLRRVCTRAWEIKKRHQQTNKDDILIIQ